MSEILMGGFSEEIEGFLARRLGEVAVRRILSGDEVLRILAEANPSLLILEHGLPSPPALQVLETIRAKPESKDLPVVYCLNEGSGAELVKRLIREYQVQEVMLPPIDPYELAWQAAALLGISISPERDEADPVQEAMAEARSRFLTTVHERVEALDQAAAALLEGRLGFELREAAQREAHKLAGLLGTIGFPSGSRYAGEMEEMLATAAQMGDARAMRFSELVAALRLELEKEASWDRRATHRPARHFSLLIVDDDVDLAEQLEAEAEARGWVAQSVRNLTEARRVVSQIKPGAILLNPHVSGNEEEGMAFLEEMTGRSPSIPVIVLTSKETFTDKVEAARRGGRGFLSKSIPAAKIAEAASQLLSRLRAVNARILAVDDDPEILVFLRALLEPRGISVAPLEDPFQFWEKLEAFTPDLLLLDVDLPRLSGVELCHVVRNDARWAQIPVIFLTQHNDAETIDRVFKAGADDFVSKPVVGPELLTRVFNRLEQTWLRRSIAETDLITKVGNRAKTSRAILELLDLARRHSQPLAFAVFEIDHLEKIRRLRGPQLGEAVLERLGGLMNKIFRSADAFGRWDNEKFAAGMYGLTRYDGVQRLNELAEAFACEQFMDSKGGKFQASLSAGVAEYEEDASDLETLSRAAESALLEAQKSGGGKALPAGWMNTSPEAAKRLDVALVLKDEAQASVLLHALKSRGCRVRWFRDGRTAAKLLAGARPSMQAKAILLGADLPGLDGLSVLKQLASDGVLAKTRAILLTAPSIENEAHSAIELGAYDCVVKPFNSSVVVRNIRRALET